MYPGWDDDRRIAAQYRRVTAHVDTDRAGTDRRG